LKGVEVHHRKREVGVEERQTERMAQIEMMSKRESEEEWKELEEKQMKKKCYC